MVKLLKQCLKILSHHLPQFWGVLDGCDGVGQKGTAAGVDCQGRANPMGSACSDKTTRTAGAEELGSLVGISLVEAKTGTVDALVAVEVPVHNCTVSHVIG